MLPVHTSIVPNLEAALIAYCHAFKQGEDVSEIAQALVTQFGHLPSSTIANADSQIADLAGLNWWRPAMSPLQRLLKRPLSERELLLKTPGLEYLYIFHRDGRIREQALDRIHGPIPNEFLVAAIAWRLNDWVPEIRAAAMRCAERCFEKTNPQILAQFSLLSSRQLPTWERWTTTERDLLYALLRSAKVIEEMARLLTTGYRGPLPSAFAKILQYADIDRFLEKLATEAVHPGVRAIALKALIDGAASFTTGMHWRWVDKSMGRRRREPKFETRALAISADRRHFIRLGSADKSALVRRIALVGIVAHTRHEPEFIELARSCLSDPSQAVRSRAEFIVKTASGRLA